MASSLKDGLVGMLKEKHSGQRKQQQQSLRGRKKYSKLKEKLKRQSGLCSESWPGLGGGGGVGATRRQTSGGFTGEHLADSNEF